MQIDQNSTGWTEAQLAKDLTAGTKFVVFSGGNGTLYSSATYEVTSGEEDKKVLVGDTDGNGKVELNDYSQIGKRLVDKASTIIDNTDTFYAAAYCDGKNGIELNDYSQLGKYLVEKSCCELINTEVKIGSLDE